MQDYQHKNSELISNKGEKFREKISNLDLNRILQKNRDQSKTQKQWLVNTLKLVALYYQLNREECKFHDIYTTQEYSHGYIDDFILKDVDNLILQKRINTEKYSHFELITQDYQDSRQLSKMENTHTIMEDLSKVEYFLVQDCHAILESRCTFYQLRIIICKQYWALTREKDLFDFKSMKSSPNFPVI